MSGQQIGTVVGGVIGAYFGGPAGAQLGMAIGGFVGGAIDPTHINGPKIGDGQQQSATDGNPIAWVQGSAMVAGTIVQVSSRRQVRHKDNGKGGPVQVTYTAEQDFAILVCESCSLRDSTMQAVLMVLQDGKVVYDVRPGSMLLADSYKWKANVDFMFGAEDQMPHPTLEAITGVGNTPAYRGSLVAVFKNFDVSSAGDRIPTFQFVVSQQVHTTTTPVDSRITSATGGGVGAFLNTYPESRSYSSALPSPANFFVDATEASPGYASTPRRTILKAPNGVIFADSGWVGPSSAQSALDAALAAAGRMDLAGALSGTDTLGPLRVVIPPGTMSVNSVSYVVGIGSNFSAHTHLESIPPPDTQDPQALSAASIVGRICERGGLSSGDVDASLLNAISVAGYPIARQANAADCLAPLLQAYFGYATEYDAKLRFKLYGEDVSVTLDRADLIEGNDANNGAITNNLRSQATEFPRRIVGSYMDPAQNYTVVDVAAERRAVGVVAIGDQAFQIPVVMAADDAAKAVNKALKVAYATLEGTQEYSTPFAGTDGYLAVAAGEPVFFQGKRWIADEMILGNGSIKWTNRYDRQSAYVSNVQAITGNAPTPPASPYSGPTTLIPMNLPSQRPQDSVGVYLAAASADGRPSWAGCTVQVSYDGQASWQNALTITMESEIGNIALSEPTGGEPITVGMVKYPLENATSAQLAAKANAFAVTDATGNITQLGQFATAAETATDLQFELTGVSRSLGGTAAAPVAAGNPFTLMDAAYFLPIDPVFAGKTLYFRAIGFGEAAEDATICSLVYSALVIPESAQFVSESGTYAFVTEDGAQTFYAE